MEGTQQKSLVLILARELAANLATPMFLADSNGMLIFYNDAAEAVVGQPFAAVGEIPLVDWAQMVRPQDADGNLLPLASVPATIALVERKPSHQHLWVTDATGARRHIELTAMPLFAHGDDLVGMVAVFWETES